MRLPRSHHQLAPVAVATLALLGGCAAPPGDPRPALGNGPEPSGTSTAALTGRVSADRRLPIFPSPDAVPAFVPDTPNPLLKYYGGHVLSNVKVYAVYWGPNVPASITGLMTGYYTTVTNSTYFDWLEEYDTIGVKGQDGLTGSNEHIGRGTFGGAITITPTNTSSTVSEADISTEIAEQVAAKHLPPPDLDANGIVDAIYMVDFPANMTFTLEGMTGGFCAYHWSVSIGGKNVPIGVQPDINTWLGGGCASYTVGLIHSHELIEAVTDTEDAPAYGDGGTTFARPGGWMSDTQGEIGDICVYKGDYKGGTVGGYDVQKVWSNQAGACVTLFPVCGGANTAPNCHNCTKFDDSPDAGSEGGAEGGASECAGPTPVCETDSSKTTLFGQCVACIDNSTCPTATPICETTTDACRACKPADCTPPTAICETSGTGAGQCVQCDPTHTTACTGATPKCDTTKNKCVGCLTGTDCSGSTPICDFTTKTCRACTSGGDCSGSLPACDTSGDSTNGQCVACTSDPACAPGTCDLMSHTCVAPAKGPDGGGNEGGANADNGTTTTGCSCLFAGHDPSRGAPIAGLALGLLLGARRRRPNAPVPRGDATIRRAYP